MRIYLDNCCLNRPFDDQTQIRIRLETEAKLKIQDEIRAGNLELVWSFILDYENSKNPFEERKQQIREWKHLNTVHVLTSGTLISLALELNEKGIEKYDSLHVACAIESNCDYFITTDDKVLNKINSVDRIEIIDPFGFLKEAKL